MCNDQRKHHCPELVRRGFSGFVILTPDEFDQAVIGACDFTVWLAETEQSPAEIEAFGGSEVHLAEEELRALIAGRFPLGPLEERNGVMRYKLLLEAGTRYVSPEHLHSNIWRQNPATGG